MTVTWEEVENENYDAEYQQALEAWQGSALPTVGPYRVAKRTWYPCINGQRSIGISNDFAMMKPVRIDLVHDAQGWTYRLYSKATVTHLSFSGVESAMAVYAGWPEALQRLLWFVTEPGEDERGEEEAAE
jgi:hypothetical protein